MPFLRKFAIAIAAIVLILAGGAGTQSSSMMLQGGGFLGLVIGLIVLYIFFKMSWRAVGCVPALAIFVGILGFVLYAIGAFNNGIGGVGESVQKFLGQKKVSSSKSYGREMQGIQVYGVDVEEEEEEASEVPEIPELFAPEAKPVAPVQVPTISGQAEVINGAMLKIRGKHFRLFGIDSPEIKQTCADALGRSYNCGQKAKNWLKGWIDGYNVECRIMGQSQRGVLLGTCTLGDYDLGAALVSAGWAVAYRPQSDIYVPYEKQAKTNRIGLWKGQFYMPWDWRTLQNKRPKIQVIKAEQESSGGWFNW